MLHVCVPPLCAQTASALQSLKETAAAWSETGALPKKMQPVIRTALTPGNNCRFLGYVLHTLPTACSPHLPQVFNPWPHACSQEGELPYVGVL